MVGYWNYIKIGEISMVSRSIYIRDPAVQEKIKLVHAVCMNTVPRILYESCDSSKLCGVQIGTVEVCYFTMTIFF